MLHALRRIAPPHIYVIADFLTLWLSKTSEVW